MSGLHASHHPRVIMHDVPEQDQTAAEYPLGPARADGGAADQPPAPPSLAYEPSPARGRLHVADVIEAAPVRNLIVPLVLIPIGCAAVYARLRHYGGIFPFQPVEAWKWTGFMLAWNLGVMLVGAYGIARLINISFGPLVTAIAKLGAIAVAPHALTLLVQVALGGDAVAYFVGWIVGFPFAWWLFIYFFDLDPQEAFICLGGITALRWFSYVIYWVVWIT